MKHYRIDEKKLILNDSSTLILMMPYIAVALSSISMALTLYNNWPFEMEFFDIMPALILTACFIMLIWAYIKKTYTGELMISDIAAIKQTSLDKSGFYIELKNGKQRNLTEIKHPKIATNLLELLREIKPSITANFEEQELIKR